jgi:hypothetical protein
MAAVFYGAITLVVAPVLAPASSAITADGNNGGAGLLIPSDNSAGYVAPPSDAVDANAETSFSHHQHATAGFAKTQRASTDNKSDAARLPTVPQSWVVATIVLGWVAVGIIPFLRVRRWLRSRRSHQSTRTSVPAVLGSAMIEKQLLHGQKFSTRQAEEIERQKSRRAA